MQDLKNNNPELHAKWGSSELYKNAIQKLETDEQLSKNFEIDLSNFKEDVSLNIDSSSTSDGLINTTALGKFMQNLEIRHPELYEKLSSGDDYTKAIQWAQDEFEKQMDELLSSALETKK